MDLKPILNQEKMKIGEYLKSTWYFDKYYEKLILVILSFLGLLRLIQWII